MLFADALERTMDRLAERGRGLPTIRAYRADLSLYRRFVAARRGLPADEVTLQDCHAVGIGPYLRHLRDIRHNRPATIARRLAALRALYGCCWLAAGLRSDPSRLVEYPQGHRGTVRALSLSDAQRLVRAAGRDSGQPLRDILMLLLLLGNGLTLAELTAIDRSDVDLERMVLRVRARPHAERTVPLSCAAGVLLRRHLRRMGNGPLWRNRSGQRLSPRGVQYVCARAAHKAGLDGMVSVQGLRVTALAMMRAAGASDETIRDLLGLRRAS